MHYKRYVVRSALFSLRAPRSSDPVSGVRAGVREPSMPVTLATRVRRVIVQRSR